MTEKLSLSELQLTIRDSLYIALPDFYWVKAEISEIKENFSGHCYLELIEKNPGEQNVRAKVKAIIWSKRHRFLKSYFENVTGEILREGIKILVRVKIEYSELYGLSLIICDIDPAFTMGEMALKRQDIIKRLENDGVFSMNKDLDFPFLPQRIAIISSANSAGYSDFINHLKGNSQGYVFFPVLFETPMQGKETERGVISSLERIAANSESFDIVAIIRGGGSQSDLSWFDCYDIAYYITQFPLPVLTGIGHDKDESVTDLVAYKSLKTPTAVANYIIDSTSEADRHLMELSIGIMDGSREILEKNRMLIDQLTSSLVPSVKLLISDIRDVLSGKILGIANTGKEYIVRAGILPANLKSRLTNSLRSYILMKKSNLARNRYDLVSFSSGVLKRSSHRLDSLNNVLEIINPENVLKRGYTITSINGKMLKKKDSLRSEDIIETRFSDGAIRSRIVEDKQN